MYRATAAVKEIEDWAVSGHLIAAIPQQMVIAETKEQRKQNELSEQYLKTKRFGWTGGLRSTFTFAIEWAGA
jgi:hypothetical protein